MCVFVEAVHFLYTMSMNESKPMRKHVPNALSILRLILSVVLGGLAFFTAPLWIAQSVFVLGIVSDKLDGTLARAWKGESELGKKLESIVDPLFATSAAIFLFLRLDFPQWIFLFALTLCFLGLALRAVCSLIAKKLFYEKSPITRYGVGLAYVVLFLYFFHIPYREWLLWPVAVYAIIVFLNYMFMMVRFTLRNQKRI